MYVRCFTYWHTTNTLFRRRKKRMASFLQHWPYLRCAISFSSSRCSANRSTCAMCFLLDSFSPLFFYFCFISRCDKNVLFISVRIGNVSWVMFHSHLFESQLWQNEHFTDWYLLGYVHLLLYSGRTMLRCDCERCE